MTPAEMIAKLDALHAAGKFHGFSIWPTQGGYQVSLATTAKNNWRIRRGETPSEGIAMVLGMDWIDKDPGVFGDDAEMLAPPLVDEPPLPDEAHEEPEDGPGIFD
jgi:hypothetical protein